MTRWLDLRSALLAVAFAAIGFLVADRMSVANAAQASRVSLDNAAGFSGTSGALVLEEAGRAAYVIVVRDNKVYKAQLGQNGGMKPWIVLE